MSGPKKDAADRCFEGMTRLIQADQRLFSLLFKYAKKWQRYLTDAEVDEVEALIKARVEASNEMGVGADLLSLEGVVTWPPLPPKAGGGA